MAALQYVDVPGYNAVILRTVLQDHRKPRALIPTSHEWLGGTDAYWNGSIPGWTFPSGATLSFGYLRNAADLAHWKGPAYAFVGFDELTEFPEDVYLGINRVLRDAPEMAPGVRVPIRKRSASNPGGPGHGWVKTRLIDPRTRQPGAVFIRATIHDNPKPGFYEEYLPTLAHLSPLDRKRLIDGDWDVMEEGGKFRREAFTIVDDAAPYVASAVKAIRYWDLAGTEPSPSNTDPDWTVGVLLVADRQGMFTILDVVRGRWNDADVEKIVRATAELDRQRIEHVPVNVFVEQDPGQAGKAQVNHYKRNVLAGFPCHAGSTRIRGVNAAKLTRAATPAAAVANGLYRIAVFPPTNTAHESSGLADFLDEVSIFPNGDHDDCVDALSGAHNHLTTKVTDVTQNVVRTSRPRARIPGVDARTGLRRP
jgi:predicted phage terminase large subunit-like protein